MMYICRERWRRLWLRLRKNPDAAFVYGKDRSVDGQGKVIATHRFEAYDVVNLLAMRIISQPAVFMRKSAFDASDGLNLDFHFMLDHQLWIQLARNAPIVYVDEFLAEAKYHEDAKNVAQAGKFADEVWRVIEWVENPRGFGWVGTGKLCESDGRGIDCGWLLFAVGAPVWTLLAGVFASVPL